MSETLKAKDDEILELFKMCNEKDKEIERLNNKIQDLQADYGNKVQVERDLLEEENKRLNNIIKEALRIAKELQYDIHDESCSHGTKKIDNLVNLLELKGSDK